MKLVAISGWKRSGKDSSADYLINSKGAIRIGFADPLKDEVAAQFGFDRSEMDKNENKEKPLLHMPAIGADGYTQHVIEFIKRELRGPEGQIPVEVYFMTDGTAWGIRSEENFPLFWSWRALCIQRGSSERVADKDHWVKQAVAQMEEGKTYVISDLRYQSELAAIKELGIDTTIIRVNRFAECSSNDPSERDLDNYPFENVIQNSGTLEDLYAKLEEIVK